ncbi:hypothetical protein R6Z07F_014443 [Ovis aries]|uniref:collagen alpha-1(I) chain-like n=1 Tax=Ovis aries TaxID=9940 RepID=UPI001C2DFD07|nr:collagen alpha-1(I) chain-like [Ovis aries]
MRRSVQLPTSVASTQGPALPKVTHSSWSGKIATDPKKGPQVPNFRENLSLLTLPQLVPQIGGTRQEEKRHPGPCKSGQPSPVQQARCGWGTGETPGGSCPEAEAQRSLAAGRAASADPEISLRPEPERTLPQEGGPTARRESPGRGAVWKGPAGSSRHRGQRPPGGGDGGLEEGAAKAPRAGWGAAGGRTDRGPGTRARRGRAGEAGGVPGAGGQPGRRGRGSLRRLRPPRAPPAASAPSRARPARASGPAPCAPARTPGPPDPRAVQTFLVTAPRPQSRPRSRRKSAHRPRASPPPWARPRALTLSPEVRLHQARAPHLVVSLSHRRRRRRGTEPGGARAGPPWARHGPAHGPPGPALSPAPSPPLSPPQGCMAGSRPRPCPASGAPCPALAPPTARRAPPPGRLASVGAPRQCPRAAEFAGEHANEAGPGPRGPAPARIPAKLTQLRAGAEGHRDGGLERRWPGLGRWAGCGPAGPAPGAGPGALRSRRLSAARGDDR